MSFRVEWFLKTKFGHISFCAKLLYSRIPKFPFELLLFNLVHFLRNVDCYPKMGIHMFLKTFSEHVPGGTVFFVKINEKFWEKHFFSFIQVKNHFACFGCLNLNVSTILTLIGVALYFKIHLLFKTILHHDALS